MIDLSNLENKIKDIDDLNKVEKEIENFANDFLNSNKQFEYPNPQYFRPNGKWENLNSQWSFCFDYKNEGEKNKYFEKSLDSSIFNKKINVPYSYTSKDSNVDYEKECNVIWYSKNFNAADLSKRYIINFQACDFETKLWVNGDYIGCHKGGFSAFNFDITNSLKESENYIVVRCEDNTLTSQCLGKQSYKVYNFACWYSRTFGIWQSVWIDILEKVFIKEYFIRPDFENYTLNIETELNIKHENLNFTAEVYVKNQLICRSSSLFVDKKTNVSLTLNVPNNGFRPYFWSDSYPNLYDIKLIIHNNDKNFDEIKTHYGLRKIETTNNYILINNQRTYLKMILDQGYFEKNLMTGTKKELLKDVLKAKLMGFNGIRKHQKIEDYYFTHFCDLFGVYVWGEVPSPYFYCENMKEDFENTMMSLVKKCFNNPSVITWVIFNESWGIEEIARSKSEQDYVRAMYYKVKSFDNTRLIVDNDGWEHVLSDLSDLITIHDYNNDENILLQTYSKGKHHVMDGITSDTSLRSTFVSDTQKCDFPVLISEYGGIAYEVTKFEGASSWGYGKRITDKDMILDKIQKLTDVVYKMDYNIGFCYTQLSDVEQEVNGLLDHNHNFKCHPNTFRKIFSKMTLGYNNE